MVAARCRKKGESMSEEYEKPSGFSEGRGWGYGDG
jgi:hypothetical protein